MLVCNDLCFYRDFIKLHKIKRVLVSSDVETSLIITNCILQEDTLSEVCFLYDKLFQLVSILLWPQCKEKSYNNILINPFK